MAELQRAEAASPHDDLSGGLPLNEIIALATRQLACLERYTSPDSAYRREVSHYEGWAGARAIALGGILRGLRADVQAGYLSTLEQLVHASVFADFLEMAEELLAKGFKDPAAVVAGSVLEEHLRKLADGSGIPTVGANEKPAKANSLNAALGTAAVYNKLEEKNVTAWLGLRNSAAHAHYDDYTEAQVALLIGGVRDFLVRHPA